MTAAEDQVVRREAAYRLLVAASGVSPAAASLAAVLAGLADSAGDVRPSDDDRAMLTALGTPAALNRALAELGAAGLLRSAGHRYRVPWPSGGRVIEVTR